MLAIGVVSEKCRRSRARLSPGAHPTPRAGHSCEWWIRITQKGSISRANSHFFKCPLGTQPSCSSGEAQSPAGPEGLKVTEEGAERGTCFAWEWRLQASSTLIKRKFLPAALPKGTCSGLGLAPAPTSPGPRMFQVLLCNQGGLGMCGTPFASSVKSTNSTMRF